MAATKQTSFGEVLINKYKGKYSCDKCTGYDATGKPITCGNNASITIHRKMTGQSEFYCKVHAKETWMEEIDE